MSKSKIIIVNGESRILNWAPALPDLREYSFKSIQELSLQLPSLVDLRSKCSPIMDQGAIGSCSAQAVAAAIEFLELEENKIIGKDSQEYYDGVFYPVSRMFIYYYERALEGTINEDSGVTSLKDGCIVVNKRGVPRESLWPYLPRLLTVKPSKIADKEAAAHTLHYYYALNDLSEMKSCLASGYPFILGITVYESFQTESVANTGIVPMPTDSEQILGGHAVMAVGYDDSKNCFIVRNSWGINWGDKGYFYLPYEFVTAGLSDDFYTLRRIPKV